MHKIFLGLIGVFIAGALLAVHERNIAYIVGVPSAFLLIAALFTVGEDRPHRPTLPVPSGRRVAPRRRT